MIKYFADKQGVEKIFINPVFKQKLCETAGVLTADEHHKLRTWRGHDNHIHVRMKCPEDSPHCVSQKPILEDI